jgi:hypothetical protein
MPSAPLRRTLTSSKQCLWRIWAKMHGTFGSKTSPLNSYGKNNVSFLLSFDSFSKFLHFRLVRFECLDRTCPFPERMSRECQFGVRCQMAERDPTHAEAYQHIKVAEPVLECRFGSACYLVFDPMHALIYTHQRTFTALIPACS